MKLREKTTATLLAILFLASMVFIAPIAATVEDGIIGLWHFDGDASDSSGFGNNGEVIGATYVDGKFDQGLKFDGLDDGVLVPDDPSLDVSEQITIEAWIYLEDTTNPQEQNIQAVVEKVHAYYLTLKDGGKLSFYWYGLSNPGWHTSSYTVPTDTWIHVAGTYDGASVKLYVDWVEVYSLAVTGTGATSASKLAIGYEPHYNVPFQRSFYGIIDEVCIRDFALVPVEVEIDIKPSSDPNSVNIGANGLLPVAILGSATFDVTQIDLGVPIALGDADLATRGPAKAPKLACSYEDVDDDGFTDLMTFFPVVDLVLTVDTDLTLTARLLDGTPIAGSDSVRVVPPE